MNRYHDMPLLPRKAFLKRQGQFGVMALGIVVFSLAVGMVGYHLLEGQPWIDAFVNASMLLGGMGPVGELHTDAGKLFAGGYAIYCGMVLLLSVGVLMAPALHRLLHHFHLESAREAAADDEGDASPQSAPEPKRSGRG